MTLDDLQQKEKHLRVGSSLFIVSLQCPSKISLWICVLNGVNMKVREIEEPKSTNKTPFPGCVYIVGIVHHLSWIYHSKKPSIYIFKRRRETMTSLCRVPCKARACEEISKQTLHHAGFSCSHPTCHTAKYVSSIGQDMTKVSTVDAKQKGRRQLQQLWPDRKSSASHKHARFLPGEGTQLRHCRQKIPRTQQNLPIPPPAWAPGWFLRPGPIHRGLVHETESRGMFPCEDLRSAEQSPHSYPVSPSEASASLRPGNTPLKA